jgi:hypothetical protein
MKLLQIVRSKTLEVTTRTEFYPIEGYSPYYVYMMKVITISGNDQSINYSLCRNPDCEELKEWSPQFVKPKFFEFIKSNNPFNIDSKTENFVVCQESINKNLTKGKLPDDWEIVWFYHSGAVLKDKDFKFLPYVLKYDYCGTYFNNEDIDLNNDFIEFLKNHPWVVNKNEIKVKSIPYYNSSPERNSYVTVKVYPDKETYNLMAQEAMAKDKRFWSCRLKDYIVSNYASDKDWFGIAPYLKDRREFDV